MATAVQHHRRWRSNAVTATAAVVLLLSVAAFRSSSAAVLSATQTKKQALPLSPLTSTSSVLRPIGRPSTTIVLPVHGNVYPLGAYYAVFTVGDPPRPYFLDVDTGSHLTWLQCDAPCVSCSKVPHPLYRPAKSKLVLCRNRLCASLRASTHRNGECESATQCDYEIEYADRGSSIGVLVNDTFTLRLANGTVDRRGLAFGCGYDQQGAVAAGSITDGVLGLGAGLYSLPSQLSQQGAMRNVVGHCLGRNGGGLMFIGDGVVPSSGISWIPISPSPENHYSPGTATLFYGKQPLGVKDQKFIFDTGSSFTYLITAPYEALLSVLKKDLSGKPLKEAHDDKSLPLCWKGPQALKSPADLRKYFNSVVLAFLSGKKVVAGLEIPPENYLIVTKQGNACLGILNGTEAGLKDANLIGDISLQDVLVVYDNEKQLMGWSRANCGRFPKYGTNFVF